MGREETRRKGDTNPTHVGDTRRLSGSYEVTEKQPATEKQPSTSSPSGLHRSTAASVPIPDEVLDASTAPERRVTHYVLVKKIGAGGMGTVWKAWDTKLARWAAVKFLSAEDPEAIVRFEREAQLAAQLRHNNIAGVHEVNHAGDRHFLVMDYVDGAPIGKEPMEIPQALRMFAKVCRAVECAHQRQIIHRDIKPANILLGKDGEPYVTDFGLAKVVASDSSLSASGAPLGTPVYMSPEQAVGDLGAIDARSDVYSLGATLYAVLTGRKPFEGASLMAVLHKVCREEPTPPREIKPEIPEEVEEIIRKAMRKDRTHRFESAAAMGNAIEGYLESLTPRPTETPVIEIRRGPSWAVIAGVAVVLIAGAVLLVVLRPWRAKEEVVDWETRFERMRGELSLAKFKASSPELARGAHLVFNEMPEGERDKVLGWVRAEIDRVPTEDWPKARWMEMRAEAGRLKAWCDLLAALLRDRGPAFEELHGRVRTLAGGFARVAAYQGTITLKIYVHPYAELRSFRVDGRWLVRNGERVPGVGAIVGRGLHTPLGIRDLEIGEYTMILSHPDLGDRTVKIAAGDLRHGKTYIYSGALEEPASLRLKPLP